jgi:hypothetical protein
MALDGAQRSLPDMGADMDYFPSSLLLLAKLADAERFST